MSAGLRFTMQADELAFGMFHTAKGVKGAVTHGFDNMAMESLARANDVFLRAADDIVDEGAMAALRSLGDRGAGVADALTLRSGQLREAAEAVMSTSIRDADTLLPTLQHANGAIEDVLRAHQLLGIDPGDVQGTRQLLSDVAGGGGDLWTAAYHHSNRVIDGPASPAAKHFGDWVVRGTF